MKFKIEIWKTLALLLTAISFFPAGAEQIFPIYAKQDPGITVDGYLEKSDWDDINFAFTFPEAIPPKQVWRRETKEWKSEADLSGKVKIAYRSDGIYIGAKIIDDIFFQTQTGTDAFKGDHVELFIDTLVGVDSSRQTFGPGQYQILLSPGNLNKKNSKAEAFLTMPEKRGLPEVLIAARKFADGYELEAMIPWKTIGLKRHPETSEKRIIGFDVVLSDTDSPEPQQDKILFARAAPWAITRGRLMKGIFTDARGTIPAGLSTATDIKLLSEEKVITLQEELMVSFTLPEYTSDIVPVLRFQAFNISVKPWYNGYTSALKIKINENQITVAQLLDKPGEVARADGQIIRLISTKDLILLPYLPNLEKMPNYGDKNFPFRDPLDFCLYRFSLDKLLKPGQNTISFQAESKNTTINIKLLNAVIQLCSRAEASPLRPAPTGKIPSFVPKNDFKTDYKILSQQPGAVNFHVGDTRMTLNSRFSTPDGKYVTDSNTHFKLSRAIENKEELFIIRDTFTNLTQNELPMIQHYEVSADLPAPIQEIRLAGLVVSPKLQDYISSNNLSAYLKLGQNGVGLYPLSDIFSIHSESYVSEEKAIGLADRCLVLKPGVSITTEIAVVPTADNDYYSFVNTMRRELDANYQIPGPLAPMPDWWVDYSVRGDKEQIKKFFELRKAHLVWTGFSVSGSTIKRHKRNNEKKAHELYALAKECAPDCLRSGYFHCFLDYTPRAVGLYPKDEVHNKINEQVVYGIGDYSNIFIPTLENEFGKDTEKNLDFMMKEFEQDTEFFYWDEFNSCKVRYSYNTAYWDGCSADIEQKTGQIMQKKSSLILMSYPWRFKMVKKIKNQYPLLMINGSYVYGKEMRKEKLIAFTEMAQTSNAARVHMSTPIGLGDHLTDDSELKCYKQMLDWLDYGLLYYWYSPRAKMTHHTLTHYMYPFTPMELGSGFIIGQERIITKLSGLWGWDDSAMHEVHVFDQNGWEMKAFEAPLSKVNGKTYTELRLPENWCAAIIRK